MKLGPRLFVAWLLVTVLGHNALGAASVRLLNLEGRATAQALPPAVFGDGEQAFHVAIVGVEAKNASLHAASFQITDSIAMPLAVDIDLKDGLSLAADIPQEVRLSIKFPRVNGPVKISYRLSIVWNGAPAIPAGQIDFEVFPAEVTKNLVDLLLPVGDSPPRAIVFGSGRKFRSFLQSLHVPFRDGGDTVPVEFAPHACYFGEVPNLDQFHQARDRSRRAHLAIFFTDDSLPPGIYSARTDSGVLVHVNSTLLDNVTVDPRAQLALIKIIRLLSNPSTNPAPDI